MATVAYASPEQLSGEQLDARSDFYSLGCSFYRLLTGQPPYPGTQPLTVMMGHINEPPPRVTALRPDLPPALDGVMARVLAKDPGQRFATSLEFSEAASAALAGTSVRTAPTVRNPTPPARPVVTEAPPVPADPTLDGGRLRPLQVFAIVFVALLIVLAGWALVRNGGAGSPDKASAVAPVVALQDPCGLLEEGSGTAPSRFGLSSAGASTTFIGQRRCDWPSTAGGNGPAFILLSSRPGPDDAATLPVRIANAIDAQETREAKGSAANCAISWTTSYGYIKLSRNNAFTSWNVDELCQRTIDLATAVVASPKLVR